MQPMSRVTAVTAKFELEVPDNLNILFSQNTNKSSRKTLRPVIVSSTFRLPAPLPELKPSSLNGSLKTISCGVLDLPA